MKPKVLALHNHYQLAGGEDAVFAAETALLEANGHEVVRFAVHNDDLKGRPALAVAAETTWNGREYARVSAVLRAERPAVVHCHNTFPQLSPAVYYAARGHGVPVVQTLHNFRLTCVNGLLFRDGKPCTRCVGSFAPWSGVRLGCYRESRPASLAVASMIAVHKAGRTYHRMVDRYIALTDFARARFIEAGLPADRIVVKPNFAADRPVAAAVTRRDGFLYVGRLSAEKGIAVLLEAARRMQSPASVTIVGDGPMRAEVETAARENPRLRVVGALPSAAVHEQMRLARAVVIPSICFENFPVVAAEAYGAGCPVVASAHGGLTSSVDDGAPGRLVAPGDAGALAATLDALNAAPGAAACMGQEGRARYERELAPAANYAQLARIYSAVIGERAA